MQKQLARTGYVLRGSNDSNALLTLEEKFEENKEIERPTRT